jgi:hypothetical protein
VLVFAEAGYPSLIKQGVCGCILMCELAMEHARLDRDAVINLQYMVHSICGLFPAVA